MRVTTQTHARGDAPYTRGDITRDYSTCDYTLHEKG